MRAVEDRISATQAVTERRQTCVVNLRCISTLVNNNVLVTSPAPNNVAAEVKPITQGHDDQYRAKLGKCD